MSRLLVGVLFVGVFMSHSFPIQAQGNQLSLEYLSRIIAQAREKYHIPAIAVTVMDSETILLQEIQGVRSIGRPDQATLDDLFHIGSCGKSVLAVMAAKLIEEKKIAWDTRFFDVFPELLEGSDDAYRDITLEDLFLCEAGIEAYTNAETESFPEYDESIANKRMAFVTDLIKQSPASRKKSNGKFKHRYSNASYTMASAMLERVSGDGYEVLVKKTLAEDLEMPVHIGWPNGRNVDQPWGHTIAGKKIESFPPDHEYKLPYLIVPAGDLSMTPKDYARYTQMHLRGLRGDNNYLSSESWKMIHFGHEGFSLGVVNGSLGGKKYSAFDGSAGTFFRRSIIVPESDFALTIMMNAGSGGGSMKAVDWLTKRIVNKHFNWGWKFWLWW